MNIKLSKPSPIILFLIIVATSVFACAHNEKEKVISIDKKPIVVTTTGMLADLVKNVGGDSVEVQALMGPGVDPHLFKATQGDLTTLRKADLIFYNGLHLEGKMGEIFQKLGQLKTVVAVAENLPTDKLYENADFQGNYDPHIWFDVMLWSEGISVVLDNLIKIDSSAAEYYTQNAKKYQTSLIQLHAQVQKQIGQLEENERILVTAHDAFNYFGRAYGMEVRGLQGISTLSEFGLRDRVELVDYIIENQIKAIFVESSVSKKNIESIVEGCKQKGHEVRIGGTLYSDAMGEPDTPAGNYIGMVQANVNTIVSSLQ